MDTCPLANLGNTCFMNACLQIMAHIPQLGRLRPAFQKHAKQTAIETHIFEQWMALYDSMHTTPLRIIQPTVFVKTVQYVAHRKNRELFTGWMQNDMTEFLLFMIECIHNSILRPSQMTITGKTVTPKDTLAIQCYTMLQKVYKTEYSEVMALLYGISITTIVDEYTHETLSTTPEPFCMIDLPVSGTTLQSCFEKYTELEYMFGENAWFNEKTGKYQNVYRCIEYWNMPEVLMITLNRYTSQQHKITDLVEFPVDRLDLSEYIEGYDKQSHVYELFGVCNHVGNLMGGHYTAFVKASSGVWFHYNDTVVQKVPMDEMVVTAMAYCLFYRKKYT